MTTTSTVALDFVYAGRRWDGSKMFTIIVPIKDGALQKEMAFEFKAKTRRTVGGVYSGAQFSEDSMVGLHNRLTYERRWDNREQLIDWESRDQRAEAQARAKKLESDDGKVSEIEKLLLPLRVQYESYRYRRDFAGMEALKMAVRAALTISPRKDETS